MFTLIMKKLRMLQVVLCSIMLTMSPHSGEDWRKQLKLVNTSSINNATNTGTPQINPLLTALLRGGGDDFINTSERSVRHHDVFIDSEVTEPANYRELISLLFNATEGDTFHFFINSNGGNLDSALAIIEGLKNTQGHVIAFIIGACHSAASFIAMYCHEVAVLDNAYSMIHTASFGSAGMTGNVKSHTDFTVRQVEKLLNETYEGFLSKDELTKVKSGVELWFDADEIRHRMENRTKFLQAKLKKLKKGLEHDE
jgi:ATP-dependent protease ClpP protease subunit